MNKHSVSDIRIQMKIQIRKISKISYFFLRVLKKKRITVTSAARGTRMKMFCNNQLCSLMAFDNLACVKNHLLQINQ